MIAKPCGFDGLCSAFERIGFCPLVWMRDGRDTLEVAHRLFSMAIGTKQLQIRHVVAASANVVNLAARSIAVSTLTAVAVDDRLSNVIRNTPKALVVTAREDESEPDSERITDVSVTNTPVRDARAVVTHVLRFLPAERQAEELCAGNWRVAVRTWKWRRNESGGAWIDRRHRLWLALADGTPQRIQ